MDRLINEIIKNAFTAAIKDKDKLKSNTLRSAKFVEYVVNNLYESLIPPEQKRLSKIYCQKVKGDGTGKVTGEWLLDAVIREEIDIQDEGIRHSSTRFVKKILWAIESESHTSLTSMAEDFGKLVVVHSENYLYLNGLNQNPTNATNYIKRRLRTIEDLIPKIESSFDRGQLYYGFWPTPGQAQGHKSFWDGDEAILKRMIRLFKYGNGSFYEVLGE